MKRNLLFLYLLLLTTPAFNQTKNKEINKYLTILDATERVQITGANTNAIPSKIYEVTISAKRESHLKNINACVGGKKIIGKLVHQHTISDTGTLEKDENAVLVFDYNSYIRRAEGKQLSTTSTNTKTITLLLSINNHRQTFTTQFHPKLLPKGAELPE